MSTPFSTTQPVHTTLPRVTLPIIKQVSLVLIGTAFTVVAHANNSSRSIKTPTHDIMLAYDCSDTETVCNNVTFTSNQRATGMVEVLRGKKVVPAEQSPEEKKSMLNSILASLKNMVSSTDTETINIKPTEQTSQADQRYIYTFTAPDDGVRVVTYDGQFLKMKNGKVVFQEQGRWVKVSMK